VHDGKQRTLKPMLDDQIKSNVELVVHKENLRKFKLKFGLATPHPEVMMRRPSVVILFQPSL
jgi:hypothetical protein